MRVIAVLKRCNTKETLIYLYRKMRGLVRRLKLAGAILLGRWSATVAQRQAELQAAIQGSASSIDAIQTPVSIPPDLEAVLLHSASVAIEVERLSILYESLAVRIARLEQAAERTLPHDLTVIGPRLSYD